MRYFKRKVIMSILFLLCGVMILFSSLVQLSMQNYSSAGFMFLVVLLFAYDSYVYMRPYLGLDEKKLIIYNGILRKEILLKDISSIDKKSNRLVITYNQGTSTVRIKLLLSYLKKYDQEQLIMDFKAKLGDIVH